MRKCGSSVLLAVGLHNLSGLVFTVLHLHSQCNPVPNLPPSVQSNHATLASSPVTALVHISVFLETDFWVFFPPNWLSLWVMLGGHLFSSALCFTRWVCKCRGGLGLWVEQITGKMGGVKETALNLITTYCQCSQNNENEFLSTYCC